MKWYFQTRCGDQDRGPGISDWRWPNTRPQLWNTNTRATRLGIRFLSTRMIPNLTPTWTSQERSAMISISVTRCLVNSLLRQYILILCCSWGVSHSATVDGNPDPLLPVPEPGKTWRLATTDAKACGYVIYLTVWDCTVVDSGSTRYHTDLPKGFCLRKWQPSSAIKLLNLFFWLDRVLCCSFRLSSKGCIVVF